jgi:hypothetical protein
MGRLFPITFCEVDQEGRWNRSNPLWTEELPFIPAVGSHIRLRIAYNATTDAKFPEREQTLPELAKQTYVITDVLQEVNAKFEGWTNKREAKVQIFVVVQATNPLESRLD